LEKNFRGRDAGLRKQGKRRTTLYSATISLPRSLKNQKKPNKGEGSFCPGETDVCKIRVVHSLGKGKDQGREKK